MVIGLITATAEARRLARRRLRTTSSCSLDEPESRDLFAAKVAFSLIALGRVHAGPDKILSDRETWTIAEVTFPPYFQPVAATS